MSIYHILIYISSKSFTCSYKDASKKIQKMVELVGKIISVCVVTTSLQNTFVINRRGYNLRERRSGKQH